MLRRSFLKAAISAAGASLLNASAVASAAAETTTERFEVWAAPFDYGSKISVAIQDKETGRRYCIEVFEEDTAEVRVQLIDRLFDAIEAQA